MALGGRTVLEQYIKGREIQVAVLDGKALPSIEIIPQADFYDYENKYQPGAAKEVCPSEIPPEWEEKVGQAAQAVFQAIGLSVYARADFIVTQDGTPYFLEINTLPGMTPTSLVPQEAAAVGIDYAAAVRDHRGGLPPGAEGRSVTAHGSHYSAGAAGGGGGDPHRPGGRSGADGLPCGHRQPEHPPGIPVHPPGGGSALTATPTSTPLWRGERRAVSPSGSGRAIGRTAFILR